jgi:hypothetical protein
MAVLTWAAEQRRSFYQYVKDRKRLFRDRACIILGRRCHYCGVEDSPDDQLRIRFVDPNDPLKDKYQSNPGTLHRRLCFEPELHSRVILLCQLCRLRRNQAIANR